MRNPMSESKSILVVEDDPSFALEIMEILREKGYTVVGIVATGEGAITNARETSPDLVLMDIMLGGDMDGRETAQEIRKSHETPILFMTALGHREQSRSSNIPPPEGFGFLVKPFTKSELMKEVRRLLRSGLDVSPPTGNSVIDGQHQELTECLNKMAAFLREEKGEQTHISCQKFWKLLDAHCADEEGILRDAGYSRMDDHLATHEETLTRINQIRSTCKGTCKENHVGSCMGNMESALTDHLLAEDMAFASFLQAKAWVDDNR